MKEKIKKIINRLLDWAFLILAFVLTLGCFISAIDKYKWWFLLILPAEILLVLIFYLLLLFGTDYCRYIVSNKRLTGYIKNFKERIEKEEIENERD